MQRSDAPLRAIGEVLAHDKSLRVRVKTQKGNLVGQFTVPPKPVPFCALWGAHPDLKREFTERWRDWVSWKEASAASRRWFEDALQVPGSVDLTNHNQPGYVIARCDALENGVVLTSQPMQSGAFRQILPETEAPQVPDPEVFFRFSVVGALPGQCRAAVERLSDG